LYITSDAGTATFTTEAQPEDGGEEGKAPMAQSAIVKLSKEDERFCRKLERIVHTRMRNPDLNIDVIASQFGMGRTNFYRKVRELMGMSPNDYLRKCRMERAALLIKDTNMPIAEICAQVGVPDAQYFSRVFKTFYGVPPSTYREQL
jgi:AraC-like DNA-binding protein